MGSAAPSSDPDDENADNNSLLTRVDGHVALVQINRPKVRNALNQALIADLVQTLERFDAEDEVRAIVLTGDHRAFAAGAHTPEMFRASAIEMQTIPTLSRWNRLRKIRKPM